MLTVWLPAGLAAAATALTVAPPERWRGESAGRAPASTPHDAPSDEGWMRRFAGLWSLLGGLGAWVFVGGVPGLVAGVVAAVVVAALVRRAETPTQRRTRALVRRDLPHLVTLLTAALRSGAAPAEATAVACAALPGPAADRLAGAVARLAVGADPVQVWERLGADPDLGPLGRALARSQDTGAAVVPTVARLAADLASRARAETEERARAVGVKAALPLGVCLLPAFVLVGIVPLVAALLTSLQL